MSEAAPAHRPAWEGAWRYAQALVAPIVIWAALAVWLGWSNAEERYDLAAIQEWLEEARNPSTTLRGLVEQYADAAAESVKAGREAPSASVRRLNALTQANLKRAEIYQHLRSLGEPATKIYPGMLPLFPTVYRLEVRFKDAAWTDVPITDRDSEDKEDSPPARLLGEKVVWDSGQLPGAGRYRTATFDLGTTGTVTIDFQLHAWNKRQRDELWRGRMLLVLLLLGGAASTLGLAWIIAIHEREGDRERERLMDQAKLDKAERELLAQRLETEEAQRRAL
jgi:hypothetical protein